MGAPPTEERQVVWELLAQIWVDTWYDAAQLDEFADRLARCGFRFASWTGSRTAKSVAPSQSSRLPCSPVPAWRSPIGASRKTMPGRWSRHGCRIRGSCRFSILSGLQATSRLAGSFARLGSIFAPGWLSDSACLSPNKRAAGGPAGANSRQPVPRSFHPRARHRARAASGPHPIGIEHPFRQAFVLVYAVLQGVGYARRRAFLPFEDEVLRRAPVDRGLL